MNHQPKFEFPQENRRRGRVAIRVVAALFVVILLITLVAIHLQSKGPYRKPPVTGDGWATASLRAVGMDEKPINELLTLLLQQGQDISGLLVVKDGKLVFETYYPGDEIILTDTSSFTRMD